MNESPLNPFAKGGDCVLLLQGGSYPPLPSQREIERDFVTHQTRHNIAHPSFGEEPEMVSEPINKWKLLNPVGEVELVDMGLAPRLSDLNGKVIGFLDNSKWNAKPLLYRMEELLRERYNLGVAVHSRKIRASGGSPEMDKLEKCDAVISGIGL